MSINDYIRAAIRTEKVPQFELEFPAREYKVGDHKELYVVSVSGYSELYSGILGQESARLLHSALGMSTEISELKAAIRKGDSVNVIEELGDVLWYWAIAMDVMELAEFKPGKPDPNALNDYGNGELLVDAICGWADLVRRHVIHGKSLPGVVVESALREILLQVGRLAQRYGSDLSTVMKKNIHKLQVRFPEKYDGDQFEDRDLAAERQVLEEETCPVQDRM